MNLLVSFQVAVRALGANKLRASLTMLGMIIGVGSVIALVSIGAGAQASVTSQIESMGTNLLFIRPGSTQSSGVATQQGSAATLTYEDSEAIAADTSLPVTGVAPEQSGMAQLVAAGNNVNTRVTGTTPDYESVRNAHPAEGEFITTQHIESKSLVIVLGANVAGSLFPDQDPIGQTVKVSFFNRAGINMRVVGIMESKGGSGLGNQDDQVYVPITTMQQRLNASRTARGGQTVSTINIQVTDESQMDQAVSLIGDLLRQRHKVVEDDFTIQSQEDYLETATEVTGVLTLLLGAIAGISLVVGGIGIMNIMLVSVTERTREIGIRKAVGARRRDILLQFMIESVLVAVVGGAIGIMVGTGASQVMSGISLSGSTLQGVVAPEAVLLAAGVSALIGVFFGIYPAFRAARLNPIEALHYE